MQARPQPEQSWQAFCSQSGFCNFVPAHLDDNIAWANVMGCDAAPACAFEPPQVACWPEDTLLGKPAFPSFMLLALLRLVNMRQVVVRSIMHPTRPTKRSCAAPDRQGQSGCCTEPRRSNVSKALRSQDRTLHSYRSVFNAEAHSSACSAMGQKFLQVPRCRASPDVRQAQAATLRHAVGLVSCRVYEWLMWDTRSAAQRCSAATHASSQTRRPMPSRTGRPQARRFARCPSMQDISPALGSTELYPADQSFVLPLSRVPASLHVQVQASAHLSATGLHGQHRQWSHN